MKTGMQDLQMSGIDYFGSV